MPPCFGVSSARAGRRSAARQRQKAEHHRFFISDHESSIALSIAGHDVARPHFPRLRPHAACNARTAIGHLGWNTQPEAGSSGSAPRPSPAGSRGLARRSDPAPARRPAARGYKDAAAHRTTRRCRPSRRCGPRYITATRWHRCRTTDKSCAMNKYVSPNFSRKSSSRFTTWAWIETSSAETGSSQTMNSGFIANARAMPTRCR